MKGESSGKKQKKPALMYKESCGQLFLPPLRTGSEGHRGRELIAGYLAPSFLPSFVQKQQYGKADLFSS